MKKVKQLKWANPGVPDLMPVRGEEGFDTELGACMDQERKVQCVLMDLSKQIGHLEYIELCNQMSSKDIGFSELMKGEAF